MIVTNAAEFLAVYSPQRFPATGRPTARAAFLVAPNGFALAPQSASDNRYMRMGETADAARALVEHAELAAQLRSSVTTIVFPGDASTPDAVFPNNAFATVPGKLIVGAMRHAVRTRETERADVRAFFTDLLHYDVIDLSQHNFAAELTGSIIIDHARGLGYCGLSERCDMDGARAMHEAFGLKLTFCFELTPGEYHTNVVLAVLAGRAVMIAPDGFVDPRVPAAIASAFPEHTITLTAAQKDNYAGNAITVSGDAVWMSERAARSLQPAQRDALASWGFAVRSVDLSEIEKAGGSLRCCVGEIF